MRLSSKLVTAAIAIIILGTAPRAAERLGRNLLIEDARRLARTIENVHPDPYIHGGGKIAFHRKLQETLNAIPDSGLTAEEFYLHLRPLVGSIGDGHTTVSDPRSADPFAPGGIPLYFATYLDGLYVFSVLGENHRELIGSRLTAVEGVSFTELVERYRPLRGADNDYLLYQDLGGQGVFWYGYRLKEILPEWSGADSIRVQLKLPDDRLVDRTLAIPASVDYASLVYPPVGDMALLTTLMTQMQRSDLFYHFVDSARQTCLMVIHDLSTYREAFEVWHSYGITSREVQGRQQYQRYNGTEPPANYEDVLAGLPSATELLRSMTTEMKQAGTKNLIIDLSQNNGGSSIMSNILLYFLYGRETAISLQGHTAEIKKYSPEYFDKFPSPSLGEINRDRVVPYAIDDYDFAGDYPHHGYPGREQVRATMEQMIARMPTFEAEYESGAFSGYYEPENVLVLCDAGTFSAAMWVMYYLKQAGAEIVGTPSAQAGNCFGDLVSFALPHSGLKYTVSRKYFELFPDDPERGKVLPPDHVLTYAKMVEYNFDPNMWLMYAEDLLRDRAGATN